MKLEQIVDEVKDILLEVNGNLNQEILSICCDSRKVKKGSLFVAVKGNKLNGDDYISDAINSGAVAVASESCLSLSVPFLQVKNSYAALSRVAEVFHGSSANAFDLIGVTGTNGKSSTVYILDALLSSAGFCTGMVGTISNKIAGFEEKTEYTTPDALSLQDLFARMKEAKVEKVSLEVSSHALSQHRIGSVPFKTAIFTNLTQDHLDYHGDMESYFQAKRKLFDEFLDDSGTAIINIDDAYGMKLFLSFDSDRAVSVGCSVNAQYRIESISQETLGCTFTLSYEGKQLILKTMLGGLFNVYNAALAVVAALQHGVSEDDIRKSLEGFQGVPGRLEMFTALNGLRVFVDYAHTPDALEKALKAIKGSGVKLFCVFGCGGDRDKRKRPLMAQAVEKQADRIWITDDNPRTEDAEKIQADIKQGFASLENVRQQPDRYKAIEEAVSAMTPLDVLLVAGKGHEDYQIYGSEKIEFCDRKAVTEILGRLSA